MTRECRVPPFGPDGDRFRVVPARSSSFHSVHFGSPRTLRIVPHRFRIMHGQLERVLGDHKSSLRAHLIWKNLYDGRRHRKTLDSFTFRSTSVNPVQFL